MNWVNKWKTHKNQIASSTNQPEYTTWLIFCLTEFFAEIVFVSDFDVFPNQSYTNSVGRTQNESIHSIQLADENFIGEICDIWKCNGNLCRQKCSENWWIEYSCANAKIEAMFMSLAIDWQNANGAHGTASLNSYATKSKQKIALLTERFESETRNSPLSAAK